MKLSFPHLRYGGEAPALAVAVAYRVAMLAHVPATVSHVSHYKRKNAAAMPGVRYIPARLNRSAAWYAITTDTDGRVRNRSFTV